MNIRLITIFSAFLLLVGCSDVAPRDKIHSFIYSTFYLKVIDQDGKPVSGVVTDIRHGHSSFHWGGNSASARYISDSHGMVRIKIDSRQITFNKMAKEGYSINLPKVLFEYYKTRSHGVPAQGNLFHSDFEKFSKEFPFIVRVWRIDESEMVANCKNGALRKFLNIDGRPYGVDLLKSGKQIMIEDASERNIQIKFYRENVQQPTHKDRHRGEDFNQNWNYSLIVSNGGLIEVEPKKLYKKTPPLSGYSEKWQLTNATFRGRDNEYGGSSREDDRHFYLKINNELYARLSIRFKPIGSSRAKFRNGEIILDYSVNIDGSRIVRGIDEIKNIRHVSKYDCTDLVRRHEKI